MNNTNGDRERKMDDVFRAGSTEAEVAAHRASASNRSLMKISTGQEQNLTSLGSISQVCINE